MREGRAVAQVQGCGGKKSVGGTFVQALCLLSSSAHGVAVQ